jgi:mono/diheme cytochrome c family protein
MKRLLSAAGLLLAISSNAQDFKAGEALFKANCMACHKMDSKLIGPPLQNTVAEQGFEWTKKWIYNNEELRASGDAHANAIYEEYNKQVMPPYSYLSDEELTNLVTYLEDWKEKQSEPVAEVTSSESGSESTVQPAQRVERKLSSEGKILLGAMAFSALMIAITILTLYRAFKTMVDVNRDLHRRESV